ncbi:glycosyltransferase [uncultured Tateyamaria sp.]|uniref:glycosyltransferase n=1 Tax=Tateyamaria sp. 1078 TaxID=3417464 RepID=UPI002620B183|nr:glycosyltransferase [uncultured Tateyamaria sp.]
MTDAPKISPTPCGLVAVVVTHNRLAALQVTLARLLETAPAHLARIVVLDNASTDGTGDWLARLGDPRLDVRHSAQNTGGAGGFEQGMRHAVATYDPDWLVVMDDDARPDPGALAAFHGTDRTGAEAWAAAVYHPDGRICDMNRPSRNPFWRRDVLWRTLRTRRRDGFHLGPEDYASDTPCSIDGTSFVGFFISRAGVARAGFPDGSLFIYGDDVLYTLGLTARGGRILFDPNLRFEHAFTTMTDGDARFTPLWKCYYHYRNLLMVYRLCAGPWFVLAGPAAALKWLAKVHHYKGARGVFVRLVLRAVWDGARARTDVSFDQVRAWAAEPERDTP